MVDFNIADWGGVSNFFWDFHITNVNGWHVHFHNTYDHQIWTSGTLEKLTHFKQTKQLFVTSSP